MERPVLTILGMNSEGIGPSCASDCSRVGQVIGGSLQTQEAFRIKAKTAIAAQTEFRNAGGNAP
jgi:hypothetical protein